MSSRFLLSINRQWGFGYQYYWDGCWSWHGSGEAWHFRQDRHRGRGGPSGWQVDVMHIPKHHINFLLNYWNLFHTGHTSHFFPFQDPGEWFDSGGGWNKPGWCNSKFCCLCPEKHIWHSSVRPRGFRPVWYKSHLLADI